MAFTGVQRQEEGQKGIDSFLRIGSPSKTLRVDQEDEEADGATVLDDDDQRPADDLLGTERVEQADLLTVPRDDDDESYDTDAKPLQSHSDAKGSWRCPRCNEWLWPDPHVEEAFDTLDRRKQEHEDHHAALDLQASFDVATPSTSTGKRRLPDAPVHRPVSKRKRPAHDIRSYLRHQ